MESPKSTIHALALFLSLSLFICIGFAASGGRMGGNSFSKRSSPRSSSHSSHFSPSNHHYHHHYCHGSIGYSSLSSQNQKIEWEGSATFTPTWVAVIITIGVVGAISVAVYFEYMHNSGSVIMVQVGQIHFSFIRPKLASKENKIQIFLGKEQIDCTFIQLN